MWVYFLQYLAMPQKILWKPHIGFRSQRHIQDFRRQVRWKALRQQLMAFSCYLLLQSSPS